MASQKPLRRKIWRPYWKLGGSEFLSLSEWEVRWTHVVREDVLHWVIHSLPGCLPQREGIFSRPRVSADMQLCTSVGGLCVYVYLNIKYKSFFRKDYHSGKRFLPQDLEGYNSFSFKYIICFWLFKIKMLDFFPTDLKVFLKLPFKRLSFSP